MNPVPTSDSEVDQRSRTVDYDQGSAPTRTDTHNFGSYALRVDFKSHNQRRYVFLHLLYKNYRGDTSDEPNAGQCTFIWSFFTQNRRTMYAVTEHSAICCKIQAKLGQLGWLTITFRHTLLGYCAHDLSSSLLNYMATLSPLYLLSL